MNAIYKIIGQDGKEYGPATAEQIRQWIAAGRVEQRTPVFVTGATEWNFVGLLPEFAGCFAGGAPPPIAPVSPPRKNNSFATAGLVLGILSVTLCWCCGGFPFNALGLIFSILALLQISEQPQIHEGRGLAVTGLILSAFSLLIFFIVLASGNFHFTFNDRPF